MDALRRSLLGFLLATVIVLTSVGAAKALPAAPATHHSCAHKGSMPDKNNKQMPTCAVCLGCIPMLPVPAMEYGELKPVAMIFPGSALALAGQNAGPEPPPPRA